MYSIEYINALAVGLFEALEVMPCGMVPTKMRAKHVYFHDCLDILFLEEDCAPGDIKVAMAEAVALIESFPSYKDVTPSMFAALTNIKNGWHNTAKSTLDAILQAKLDTR